MFITRVKNYINKLIAFEISTISRYYDNFYYIADVPESSDTIYENVIAERKHKVKSVDNCPNLSNDDSRAALFFFNGSLNHNFDIQALLTKTRNKMSRESRIVAVLYNPYLKLLYKCANLFRIRRGPIPETFLTMVDLENLAIISFFKPVRIRPTCFFPFKLFGIGDCINWIMPMVPLIRKISLTYVITLRPIVMRAEKPSISIIIPARNEKGNIENALKRMPAFEGVEKEIIYVEGKSTDGTWEEIQRVAGEYSDQFDIKIYQQTGKGKNDAVRLGFDKATKRLVTILDADLTMPPELLERFYDAYTQGNADFINGSRLVYPMEGKAMRSLNLLGNKFFAKALSFVLDSHLGDSLCGTKLISKRNYQRLIAWRKDFGDFDPFGDFEMLFSAAILGFGIVDIPIRYLSRTYGSPQIDRFRDGMVLFKMTWLALIKIKPGVIRYMFKR
jgi:hypothetical protein